MKRFALVVVGSILLFGAGCSGSTPRQAMEQPSGAGPEAATQQQGVTAEPSSTTTADASATDTTPVKAPAPKAPVKKPTTKPVTGYVSITDGAFEPQVLAVSVGTTVIWTNKSTKNQTVRSDGSNLYDSGNIPPGSTYKHTFPAVGTYPYYSASNPSLKGTIVVR
jgi:plastocyanin